MANVCVSAQDRRWADISRIFVPCQGASRIEAAFSPCFFSVRHSGVSFHSLHEQENIVVALRTSVGCYIFATFPAADAWDDTNARLEKEWLELSALVNSK